MLAPPFAPTILAIYSTPPRRPHHPIAELTTIIFSGKLTAPTYLRDLPDAKLDLIDTGHFALKDKLDVVGE